VTVSFFSSLRKVREHHEFWGHHTQFLMRKPVSSTARQSAASDLLLLDTDKFIGHVGATPGREFRTKKAGANQAERVAQLVVVLPELRSAQRAASFAYPIIE